jgi:pyrroline-5-carboxylate reductase
LNIGIVGVGTMGDALMATILKVDLSASSNEVSDKHIERLTELQKK